MATDDNTKDLFTHAMSEFLKENYGKSKELLNGVLEADPNHKLALVTRGTAHLKLNHADSALDDFNRALEVDPTYARALHMRGAVRERLGDDEEALSDFGRAIEINPEYAAAYYSRATLLSKLGREDQATEDIERVMHLTNRNIETFANDSNVWRTQHMRLESMLESELGR
jgi:tetratricopeptide (TPR) repeat protein